MKKITALIFTVAALLLSGCANLVAPKYSFSPESVQTIKDAGSSKVRVGKFSAERPDTETAGIGMRGNGFSSPYGSFTEYLQQAIQQEFTEAGRYAADASTSVDGVLVKHVFNANGMSVGEGEIVAAIKVVRNGTTTYDKQLTAKTTWESSFAAMSALPKAQTEYPKLVREFVRVLSQDADFMKAIK
jgi:hypothetical protein